MAICQHVAQCVCGCRETVRREQFCALVCGARRRYVMKMGVMEADLVHTDVASMWMNSTHR